MLGGDIGLAVLARQAKALLHDGDHAGGEGELAGSVVRSGFFVQINVVAFCLLFRRGGRDGGRHLFKLRQNILMGYLEVAKGLGRYAGILLGKR